MDKHLLLTRKRLQELLHYNPETGVFTWLQRSIIGIRDPQWNGRYAGTEAGSIKTDKNGRLQYRKINMGGKVRAAHRLAFLYMTGKFPPVGVDHKDGNSLNNCWDNLRPATQSENSANSRISKNNSTGFKGVMFHKVNGYYTATITKQRHKQHLGCFSTPEEAHTAYVAASKKHFGEFARAN